MTDERQKKDDRQCDTKKHDAMAVRGFNLQICSLKARKVNWKARKHRMQGQNVPKSPGPRHRAAAGAL
jgi:hypothetical protein